MREIVINEEKRNFKGAWTSAGVYRANDLNWTEKHCLMEIVNLNTLDDGCVAWNNHFAQYLGIAKTTARNTIHNLKSKGYIEADVIGINSFYIESTQKANNMYKTLSFKEDCLVPHEPYYLPFIGNYGAIIINTKVMEEKNLPLPKSVKELALPVYKDWLSVCDLAGSTTAWYMFLPIIADYGEANTKEILHKIYENAGPHLEMSGSAPLKKVRAGEVALGFGLRHQAVKDKRKGLPIDYIDPAEGSYSMTESIAVIDKGKKTNPLAEEMLKTMIEKGRADLIKDYPVPIYKGETVASENLVPNGKVFAESLTAELFTKHREISESAK